jgi:hypothetical protein
MQQDFAGMHGRQPLACNDIAEFHAVHCFALNTHFILLMIVNDFHFHCVTVFPSETYPPLLVDANAPLPGAVATQQLQTVAGWHPQLLNPTHGINELKLAPGYRLYVMWKPANQQPGKYRCRGFVREGFDHSRIVLMSNSIVKRYYFNPHDQARQARVLYLQTTSPALMRGLSF